MIRSKKNSSLVLCALLILFSAPTFAQNEEEYLMEIGVSGGFASSVNDANTYKYFDPAFGALLRYRFNNRIAIRGEWYTSEIHEKYLNGDKETDFNNLINSFSLCGEFNFFDLTQNPYKRLSRKFSPYIFTGFGIVDFMYEDAKIIRPTIPFGVGIKFKLTNRLNLNIQYDNQLLMSDRLEGIAILNDARNNGSNFLNNDLLSSLKIALTFDFFKKPCDCNDVSR